MCAYPLSVLILLFVCWSDSTPIEINFSEYQTNTVITEQFVDLGVTFSTQQPFEFPGPRVEDEFLVDLHNFDQSEVADLILSFDAPATYVGFDLLDADEPSVVRLFLNGHEIYSQFFPGGGDEEIYHFSYEADNGKSSFDRVILDVVNTGLPGPEFAGNFKFRMEFDSEIGDVNCDGNINLLDVRPFTDLILSGGFQKEADTNMDGVVDILDIDSFVAILVEN